MSEPGENEQGGPPMRRSEAVAGIIRAAIDASGGTWRSPRRHPAEVTADRLVDHATAWDKFTGPERDAIGEVIQALREIAEGER